MDEHASKVPCPEGCTVIAKGSKWLGSRKGQDTDIYYFDVVDSDGSLVSSHEVHDSTSVYPPHGRTIRLEK